MLHVHEHMTPQWSLSFLLLKTEDQKVNEASHLTGMALHLL